MRNDRPSTTALLIGLSLMALHARRDAASPISDDDARLVHAAFRRLGGRARTLAWLAARRSAAPIVRVIEWVVAPGMIRQFGERKQLIEACAEDAVAAGCGRVVVLAAGLDLLTLHLARRHPDLSLVELDHPATHTLKHEMYAAAAAPDRITLVAADLAQRTWEEALLAALQPAQPTLFVAEGLSMYLTGEQWGALLDTLAGLPGATRLVFTFMEPGHDGRAILRRQRRVLGALLAASRERFRWGIPLGELGPFVERHGWRLGDTLGPERFGGGSAGEFVGEYIAVCRILSNVSEESSRAVVVRQKSAFLRRAMELLAGDATISLTGDLSTCSFPDTLVVPRIDPDRQKRSDIVSCFDFVVLWLRPETVEPIFREIMRAGLKRKVVHIRIVCGRVQEFGAFDNFHPDCVCVGPRFTVPLLEQLCEEGILWSFDPDP